MIHTINTEFQMQLERLIAEDVTRLTDQLVTGGGIGGYSDYCRLRGQIEGLKLVVDRFEDVNKFLDSKR